MELRVFFDKLGQDGALGFNGNAVAKGLIVTAEAQIERGVILRLFQKMLPPSNVKQPALTILMLVQLYHKRGLVSIPDYQFPSV